MNISLSSSDRSSLDFSRSPLLSLIGVESTLGAEIEGAQHGRSTLKEQGLFSTVSQTHTLHTHQTVSPSLYLSRFTFGFNLCSSPNAWTWFNSQINE